MKRAYAYTAFYVLVAAIFPGCTPDATGPGSNPNQFRTCMIEYATNWPGGTINPSTDSPWGCPVTLSYHGQTVPFHAVVNWTSSGYVESGYVEFVAYNRNFNFPPATYMPQWTYFGGVTVQGPGHYDAGTGTSGNSAPQHDYLHFNFRRASNGENTGVAWTIPWQDFGFPLIRIVGPYTVQPWASFTLNADVLDPTFVPPVTYSWTRNGIPLSYTTDYFQQSGNDMGTDYDFTVTVTDSEGRTLTEEHHVHTLFCYGEGCNEY